MGTPLDLRFLASRTALARVAATTAAFALAGLAYALLAPKWYRSTLTLVPAKAQRGGGLSSLLPGELAGLAGAFDIGGSADVNRIAAVLQGTGVTDAVIERFDLRARYREKTQEATREELWRHCEVRALSKSGLVQLSCEDRDPRFAQELLAFFAEHGNQAFRRVSVSSASEEVKFLEQRVGELRKQADEVAGRMREFQERHQIVDLDTQARAVVSALAALHAQRINKELELDFARTFASRDEASSRQLRSQIAVMEEKLRDLEVPRSSPEASANAGRPAKKGVFPAALEVPRLRAEFEALFRDRKVAELTLVFALERLEAARAEQARNVSTFQVLDAPPLPTRKSRPRPLELLVALGAVGLLGSVALEWWRNPLGRGSRTR